MTHVALSRASLTDGTLGVTAAWPGGVTVYLADDASGRILRREAVGYPATMEEVAEAVADLIASERNLRAAAEARRRGRARN